MLENPSDSSSLPNAATVKRYAPPNQRNRSLGRRKSGADRLERANNSYLNDGEKNQVPISRNVPITGYGDTVGSNLVNEPPHSALIPLNGCCNSEAAQLLSDRWAAAINAYNDPSVDLADRPVMYSGSSPSASAWGQFRLPHQLMSPTAGTSGSQIDFLSELQRAIRDANAGT